MIHQITSFGYRHEGAGKLPAPGTLVIDVRKMFSNPWSRPALRNLPGTDPAVQIYITRQTANFSALYDFLLQKCRVPDVEEVFVGCTGGHHRSVFIAEKLAKDLGVPVVHRDLNKK